MKKAAAMLLLAGSAYGIDNGYGLLPPMGWRSWNCYGANVNQSLMQGVMDALVAKQWTQDGKQVSIADLGFKAVGLDDNWQACGAGLNGSFHDAQGNPLINKQRFPDMKAMTGYGHARGLRVGWYANNCICREHSFVGDDYIAKHMEESVKAAAAFEFDGIKLDGCGQFRNLTWWAQLLNETGRPIMIENCHWGGTVPGQTTGDAPCRGDSGISDCPYNFFRSSGDIRNNWDSMMSNLQTTIKFQGDVPLSRPGAWAYPDMLEVGRMPNFNEDRSHFGAWVIVSSPLILGLDVTSKAGVEKVWPIISNPEVLAISQTWAGHPGKLIQTSTPTSCTRGKNWDAVQVWMKPLAPTRAAVFVVNTNCQAAQKVSINVNYFAGKAVSVRDAYLRKDVGTATGTFETDAIDFHDSRMYILTAQ